jgi:hypothetical protein
VTVQSKAGVVVDSGGVRPSLTVTVTGTVPTAFEAATVPVITPPTTDSPDGNPVVEYVSVSASASAATSGTFTSVPIGVDCGATGLMVGARLGGCVMAQTNRSGAESSGGVPLSRTMTSTSKLPTPVGVPVTTPVAGSAVNPPGSPVKVQVTVWPLASLKVNGTPPAGSGTPRCPVGNGEGSARVGARLMRTSE